MSVSLTWREGEHRSVDAKAIRAVLAEVAAASSTPVIVVLEIEDAAMHVVVGDVSGTVLDYFPPGYAATGTGSLHTVGDRAAASADASEPALTAYYLGHHTEFPRWSLISHELGQRAIAQFCERPTAPPDVVEWELD